MPIVNLDCHFMFEPGVTTFEQLYSVMAGIYAAGIQPIFIEHDNGNTFICSLPSKDV